MNCAPEASERTSPEVHYALTVNLTTVGRSAANLCPRMAAVPPTFCAAAHRRERTYLNRGS